MDMNRDKQAGDEDKERYQLDQIRREAGEEEEFAAEVAPPLVVRDAEREVRLHQPEEDRPQGEVLRNEEAGQRSRAVGWFAIVLAALSLFMWPVVLGPAAAVMGFVAFTQGSRALGIWSIVIGLISFLAYVVLVPMYA